MVLVCTRSLHPVAAHHNGNRYRDDPQRRQCHPPIEGEQAQGNEHRRDEGTEQTWDEVGAVLFQHLAVRHDGAGQIGKIALAKKDRGSLRSRSAMVRRRVTASL